MQAKVIHTQQQAPALRFIRLGHLVLGSQFYSNHVVINFSKWSQKWDFIIIHPVLYTVTETPNQLPYIVYLPNYSITEN